VLRTLCRAGWAHPEQALAALWCWAHFAVGMDLPDFGCRATLGNGSFNRGVQRGRAFLRGE